MRKIFNKKIYFVFLSLFLLIGCENYLEDELFSDIAGDTFPTENTAETLINAAYPRAGYACLTHHRLYWATEYPTPCVMYRFRRGGSRGYFDQWSWTTYLAYYDLMDRLFYTVRSCNDAIDLVPDIEDMEDTERQAEIVAEARFLRATMYFYMVRLWGGMPIIEEAQTLSDDLYPVRASIAETYDFIIEDLQAASEVLKHRSECINDGLIGHATKEAAMGTLAKVYITMAGEPLADDSHLAEAKDLLDKIIASGEQELLADYSAVFDWRDGNNKEFLFAWQAEGDNQTYSAFHYFIPQKGSYLYLPEGRSGITYDLVEPEYAIYYM